MKIAIVGGGQLGQMLGLAGIPLGHQFSFLDPNSEAPARSVGELVVGHYDDRKLLGSLAERSDVVTFEFENVPVPSLAKVPSFKLHPSAAALETSQDRVREKTFFTTNGIPTTKFFAVDSLQDLNSAIVALGLPIVVKTRRFGYDGKGQAILHHSDQANAVFDSLGSKDLIAEKMVNFDRELSLIAVRSMTGEVRSYPLIENHHRDGILRWSLAPAPNVTPKLQEQSHALAVSLMEKLDYVGVVTLELFDTMEGLLANEFAPRVHNSGHWTIEGAVCSQFENHLRAICGMPLGSTHPITNSLMVNLIGSLPKTNDILATVNSHLHLYHKSAKPGRKLGHFTICDDSLPHLLELITPMIPIVPGLLVEQESLIQRLSVVKP